MTFLFLLCFLLSFFPTQAHLLTDTHRQGKQILEALVCLQVYVGVGGDFSLRLHSLFLPPTPKMFLILQAQPTLPLGGGGDISLAPQVS